MSQTAAHLVDHVIPAVPVRQWGLSLPMRLRLLLAARPELMTLVQEVQRAPLGYLQEQAGVGRGQGQGGAVTVIQRFGSAANLNIHLHCLVLDGVYRCGADGEAVSIEAGAPCDEQIHAVLQTHEAPVVEGPATGGGDEQTRPRPARIGWAGLLARVFDIDVRHCPSCGSGEFKIIAADPGSGGDREDPARSGPGPSATASGAGPAGATSRRLSRIGGGSGAGRRCRNVESGEMDPDDAGAARGQVERARVNPGARRRWACGSGTLTAGAGR